MGASRGQGSGGADDRPASGAVTPGDRAGRTPTSDRPASGAVAPGGGGGGRPGWLRWLLPLLAVLALGALALILFTGGDDDEPERAQAPAQTQEPAPAAGGTADADSEGEVGNPGGTQESGSAGGTGAAGTAAEAGAGGEAGTLVAGGRDLLPAPAEGFGNSVGQDAEGRNVVVQELTEDGFFVGSSEDDRVFVEWGGTVGEDESDTYLPKVGDRVNLEGPVRPAPENPRRTLKLDREDAEVVSTHGAYVNADSVEAAS